MQLIPEQFTRRMVQMYDAEGRTWLDRLPVLIAEYEHRWSITVMSPFANLSYNYVAPAVRSDGTNVILKLGMPHPELRTEIAALRIYDGRGSARLLDADPEQGALLLERLMPGTLLSSLDDDEEATAIAAKVMRQLWHPVPTNHTFPTITQWTAGLGELRTHFGGTTGPFPSALVAQAETLFAELSASMAEPVVLHGDLHHDNILAAERQPWLAIDPKGLIGEPAYEVGVLLRNPYPQLLTWPQPARILARRVDQLAEALVLDRKRILGWSIAQAVLSAWWSFEDNDNDDWKYWVTCAELLAAT